MPEPKFLLMLASVDPQGMAGACDGDLAHNRRRTSIMSIETRTFLTQVYGTRGGIAREDGVACLLREWPSEQRLEGDHDTLLHAKDCLHIT